MLRVSPGDNQAWVIQVISPISLKLGRFKVSFLKLKILKWFTFWNFPGGDRPPPLLFLVWRTEILLLQAPKEESCSAKGMHQFMLLLDTQKYTYFGILLEKFQFIWMYWRQSGTSEIYPCHAIRHELTKYLIFRSKNLQWATFILQTIFITVKTNPWPCNINNKIFGIC